LTSPSLISSENRTERNNIDMKNCLITIRYNLVISDLFLRINQLGL